MADFRDTGIGEISTQLPAQGGLAAPADYSSSVSSAATGKTIEVLGGLGAKLGQHLIQSESNENIADFVSQQIELADAANTGQMTVAQANRRRRAAFVAAIRENPNYTDQIMQVYGQLSGGVGKIEGTAEYREYLQIRGKAVEDGWVDNSAPSEVQAEQVEEWRVHQRRTDELQMAAAKREEGDEVAKDALHLSLTEYSKSVTPRFNREINNLTQQAMGADAETRLQLISQVEQMEAQLSVSMKESLGGEQAVAAMNELLGDDGMSLYTSPFMKRLSNLKEFIKTGELEVFENAEKLSIAKNKAAFRNMADLSSRTRALVTILDSAPTEALPTLLANISAAGGELYKALVDRYEQGSTGADIMTGSEASAEAIKGVAAMADTGGVKRTPEQQADWATKTAKTLNNLFRSVNKGADDAPTAGYKQILDLLSSNDGKVLLRPEVYEQLDRETLNGMIETVTNFQNDKVVPQVKDKLLPSLETLKQQLGLDETLDIETVYDMSFNGGVASFSYNQDFLNSKPQGWARENRGVLDRNLSSLNKTIGRPISKLVLARGNLGGDQNYKATFEAVKRDIFPQVTKTQESVIPENKGPLGSMTNKNFGSNRSKATPTDTSPRQDFIESIRQSMANSTNKDFATAGVEWIMENMPEDFSLKTDRGPTPDISDNVLSALSAIESGGDPKAVSPAGAIGEFQIMPATAKNPGFGVEPLSTGKEVSKATRDEQLRFVRDYLGAMLREFGSYELALAAYNAGPKRVQDFVDGKRELPQETKDYIQKFKRYGIE